MTSNIAEFNAVVDRFTMRVPDKALLLHKKIAFQAIHGIVMKNPVLTGRSKGNWQASIGEPAQGNLDAIDKDGAATISRCIASLEGLKPYEIIYISNNVPYIVHLEEGSSQQAPAGMVAVTVEELKAQFI
jgi:hypothetical protein